MQPVAAFALQERVWFRVSLLFSLFFLLGGGWATLEAAFRPGKVKYVKEDGEM